MKVIKSSDFNELVLGYVRSGLTYMESVLQICEDRNIEPEDVKSLVKGVLLDKLEAEANSLNMLKIGKNTTLENFL